jgi:single-stranded DNA-binding protein
MNNVQITGYTSFSKVHNFQGGGFSHRFSVTLQAGKNKDGTYRKEYIDVRLGSDCSAKMNYLGDGCKVQIQGRLRCEPWIDREQNKRKAIYVEGFEAQVLEAPNPQFQQQQPRAPQGQMQQPPMQQQYNHYGQGAGNHAVQPPVQQQPPMQQPPMQQQRQPYVPPHGTHQMPSMNQGHAPMQQAPMAPQAPMPPQAPQAPTAQELDDIPF